MTGTAGPGEFAGMFCAECGRPKLTRLFAASMTGCPACDEVIGRHCCMGRPALADRPDGARWTCPDCGSGWVAVSVADACGECGQPTAIRRWELTDDRRSAGPRRQFGTSVAGRLGLVTAEGD